MVRRGGDFDRWDLEARAGLMGAVRTRLAVEEHGGGNQLVRLRCWPRWSRTGLVAIASLTAIAATAVITGAPAAGALLGATAIGLVVRSLLEWSATAAAVADAFAQPEARPVGVDALAHRLNAGRATADPATLQPSVERVR